VTKKVIKKKVREKGRKKWQKHMSVLFVLGSGASVDSGLSTYRGVGMRQNIKRIDNRSSLEDIWGNVDVLCSELENSVMGETYKKIEEIISLYPKSVILTQNIDGLVHNLKNKCEIVELHGNIEHMKCILCHKIFLVNKEHTCPLCYSLCTPNIILIGDQLKQDVQTRSHRLVKKKYEYVLVVGTTLQFPYLRKLINSCKCRGAKVVHINPDNTYNDITYLKKEYMSYIKTIKVKNVRRGEDFINLPAAEGLQKFLDNRSTPS
jgi:NAD-dependent deacetylase